MAYTGRCACGAVTAEIAADAPIAVRQCWCRQCQQLAGGSHSTNAMFLTTDVTITGTLAAHAYTAASGNTLTQSFCPACGTPVMAQVSARPQFRTMRVGFIAPPHDLTPQLGRVPRRPGAPRAAAASAAVQILELAPARHCP